jgi:hypothetical protein
MTADSPAPHEVAGLQGVQRRPLSHRAGDVEVDLPVDTGEGPQVRSGARPKSRQYEPRPTARRAGRGRSPPSSHRSPPTRRPSPQWCRSTSRLESSLSTAIASRRTLTVAVLLRQARGLRLPVTAAAAAVDPQVPLGRDVPARGSKTGADDSCACADPARGGGGLRRRDLRHRRRLDPDTNPTPQPGPRPGSSQRPARGHRNHAMTCQPSNDRQFGAAQVLEAADARNIAARN